MASTPVDEFRPSSIKETEFDSSVATLIRIDQLIRLLHRAAINDIPDRNDDELFLEIIERLYVEAQNKMDYKERAEALWYLVGIDHKKKEYGNHLYQPIFGTTRKPNPHYRQGWREIKILSKQFEIFIMRCMDRHNMLMKDQKDAMTRFRTGAM